MTVPDLGDLIAYLTSRATARTTPTPLEEMLMTTTTGSHPTDGRLNGPVHKFFGLSYSNYLVLHRTFMQSMPVEWQERMVACLRELDRAFVHVEQADCYDVTAAAECEYSDLNDADMKALGITQPDAPDGDDEDAEPSDVFYDKDGNEHQSWERLLVPRPGGDPVPHYNRGRTYVEPKLAD